MEMLVVLTLVSLLGSLLVQGLGFFAARYEAVKRHHRDADLSAMHQHWFATTVRGIVPVGVRARALRGDASSFAATSLQPLAGEAGVPAWVRWTLAEQPSAVIYKEHGLAAAAAGPIAWRLPLAVAGGAAFQYAARAGSWHDQWPTADAPDEWTPMFIRLVENPAAAPRVVWIARIAAAPYPLPNEFQLQ